MTVYNRQQSQPPAMPPGCGHPPTHAHTHPCMTVHAQTHDERTEDEVLCQTHPECSISHLVRHQTMTYHTPIPGEQGAEGLLHWPMKQRFAPCGSAARPQAYIVKVRVSVSDTSDPSPPTLLTLAYTDMCALPWLQP